MPTKHLLQAAAWLLKYANGELTRTNLNKALFYFDLAWYRDTGATYTGATYVALPRGPVVDGYKVHVVEALVREGLAAQHIVRWNGVEAKLLRVADDVEGPDDPRLELVLRQVAEFVGPMTADAISEVSHDNLGWRAAIRNGDGTPINMLLALQQLGPRDPWLSEAMTPAEIEAAFKDEAAGAFA